MEKFMSAERGAGFRSKFPGRPATGGFSSSRGVSGQIKIVYLEDKKDDI